jgi:hypothetical protein
MRIPLHTHLHLLVHQLGKRNIHMHMGTQKDQPEDQHSTVNEHPGRRGRICACYTRSYTLIYGSGAGLWPSRRVAQQQQQPSIHRMQRQLCAAQKYASLTILLTHETLVAGAGVGVVDIQLQCNSVQR